MSKLYFITLNTLIAKRGITHANYLLSSFCCPLNPNVEHFLHNNAVNFSNQGISITYLVFLKFKNNIFFIAYFSLVNKIVHVKANQLNSKQKRIIKRFGNFNTIDNTYSITLPLIAQFGKNFNYNSLISGSELLQMALSQIKYIQTLIGGRAVYLECNDNEKLLDFYQRNGFSIIGTRTLPSPDTQEQYLCQLLYACKHEKSGV